MSRGFIATPRAMFDTDPLFQRRPWHEGMAWLDVVQMAASRPYEHMTEYGVVKLERGEVLLSRRLMAARWGWSEKVVRRWLESGPIRARLRAERKVYNGTVYRVVNYDTYDVPGPRKGREMGQEMGQEKAERRPKIDQLTSKTSNNNSGSEIQPTPAVVPQTALEKLPKSLADQAYVNWGDRFGPVDYGRLRKVLLQCVEAGIPPEQLPDAVEGYADWVETRTEHEKQFTQPTPERFAQNARYYARLGSMPYFRGADQPTERGLLMYRGIKIA